MKKKAIFLIFAVVLAAGVWAIGGWLLATQMPFQRQNQTTSFTLSVPEGAILHVDATVRQGTVRYQVVSEQGNVFADEEITRSYNYAVQAFRAENYIVTIQYQQAVADVNVYLTEDTAF